MLEGIFMPIGEENDITVTAKIAECFCTQSFRPM
jgi:hypothetical protein